jgi:hypothetical protein
MVTDGTKNFFIRKGDKEKMILDGTQKIVLAHSQIEYEAKYKQSENALQFTLVDGEREDGVIPVLTYFFVCRENMVTLVENEILKRKDARNFDMGKSRFLVKIRRAQEDRLSRAIHLVNCYESAYGFPLTRCYRTVLVNKTGINENLFESVQNHISIYYIVGSRKWIKSSYLVSMYFLILRCAFQLALKDEDVESIEAFEKFINNGGIKVSSDRTYLASSFKYWRKILENYQNLFGKFSIEHNWDAKFNEMADSGTMRYEGIQKLCDRGSCRAPRVLKLFNKYVVNPQKSKGE